MPVPTTGGLKERFRRNVDAIKTIQTLEIEGRDRATPDEQRIISRFTGWGQFPGLFGWSGDWAKERDEFKALVSEEEHDAAQSAINYSHFTAPEVLDAHWKIAKRLGFKGGRFLETSAGSGHYLGTMPPEIAARTHVTAVEKEPLTAKICKYLYPAAHVENIPFEQHAAPDGFYDLVASNVPFGNIKVHDPRYNKFRAPIHDYFFLKSADLARPGGLVMHVTSDGTMDKPDSRGIREHLAKSCDFVGAIRFPADTHKGAANTDVVTDLVILRKRQPGEEPPGLDENPPEAQPKQPGFTGVTTDSLGRVYHWRDGKRVPGDEWLQTQTVPDPGGGKPIEVNSYFANNPAQILGTLNRTGTRYDADSKSVSKTDDFEARLEAAIERLPEGIFQPDAARKERFSPSALPAPGDVKPGSYAIQDGQLYQRHGGALEPVEVSPEVFARIEGQIAIRDALRATLNAQVSGDAAAADAGRQALNAAYDAYVENFGPLNNRKNHAAYQDDPDSRVVRALELWDAQAKTATKRPVFSQNVAGAHSLAGKAESVGEAVGVSLHETAGIDLGRIAALTGQAEEDIADELLDKKLAFPDPSRGWVAAAEYLSGNVKRKLVEAKAAAANDPRYKVNVETLEAALPPDVDYTDIEVKLSTPWIPTSDIELFAAELTGRRADSFEAIHHERDASWEFGQAGSFGRSSRKRASRYSSVDATWGAGGLSFENLLEAALNNRVPVIRTESDRDGKTFVDVKKTEDVKNKIGEIRERFKKWVWQDDERRQRLAAYFNANFNNLVKPKHDGSHLTFPGMDPNFKMRDIQKNFVWQVVSTGRGLCAHEVGLGKTASMVAAGMELRRLGLARKPAIVCLKSNIEQITREAQDLYPAANIISTAGQFDADARNEAFSRIATGDYDMVILTHDHLNKLPMSPDVQAKFLREEVKELDAAIEATFDTEDTKKGNRMRKPLEAAKKNLEAALKKAIDKSDDDSVTFEQTGIDFLMVDEAHKFKNLPVYTRQELKGIPTAKSQRSSNMLMKTQWLQERNGGRGVVFATGTPISNTVAELYNMQRFIQPEVLKDAGLSHFDAWLGMFGEPDERSEFTISGQYKPVRRIANFGNVAELQQMAFQFLDVQRGDWVKTPEGKPVVVRPERRDHVIVSPRNKAMDDFMQDIQLRAKNVGRPGQGENMLVICTDGRKAAVDMRLFDPAAEDHPESKVNKAVDKLMELYHGRPGTTQLVFSDVGVHPPKPKKKKKTNALDDADTYAEIPETLPDDDDGEEAPSDGTTRADLAKGSTDTGHSVYKDMIDKLVARGVPREEIADFGVLEGKAREEAQAGMRAGTVRIGFGSTARLGTGTNVQKRITAMHHLDVPWTPADIEQREGRGYRHGNMNAAPDAKFPGIDIYKYVQEGSMDQAFWQIVGRKAGFIHQFQNDRQGGMRSMREEDTESLSPEQLMAVASGDMRVFDKINLEDEVKRLRSQKDSHRRGQEQIVDAIANRDKVIKDAEKEHADLLADAEHVARHVAAQPDFAFHVHINRDGAGRVIAYDERKAAAAALGERIAAVDHEFEDVPAWRHDQEEPRHVGTYRDMRILRYPGAKLRIVAPSGREYPAGESLQSIEYVSRNLGDKAEKLRAQIDESKADQERLKAQIGTPWGKEETLKAKTEELAALEAALKETNKSKETPAAESEGPPRGAPPTATALDTPKPPASAFPDDNDDEPAAESQEDFETPYHEYVTLLQSSGLTPRPFEAWKDDLLAHRARRNYARPEEWGVVRYGKESFDPNEPRDADGKWTASGSGGADESASDTGNSGAFDPEDDRINYAAGDGFHLDRPANRPKPAEFQNIGKGQHRKLFTGLDALAGQRDLFDDLDKPAEPKPKRELFAAGGWRRYLPSTREAYKAAWQEEKHPRTENGRFGSGGLGTHVAADHPAAASSHSDDERREIAAHFASARHAPSFEHARAIRQAAMRRLNDWARRNPAEFEAERTTREKIHAGQPEYERYGAGFDESKHPRDEGGKFSTKNKAKGSNKVSATLELTLGIAKTKSWDDVRKPGVWFRVQPKGKSLDHKTETSNGEMLNGVHVFHTLAQAVLQEGAYDMEGYELVAISGPKQLPDSEDVEGWFLPAGKGNIIGRFDFDSLVNEYRDEKNS